MSRRDKIAAAVALTWLALGIVFASTVHSPPSCTKGSAEALFTDCVTR